MNQTTDGLTASRANSSAHRVNTRALANGIEPHPLEFTGSGREYFGVWIVNLLLTIVTLGLYTPFARRRKAQYFYSHTLVAGSPLEFTAQQRKMVFGFLLLVFFYLAFKLAADTGQDTAVSVFMLGGAALAPYLWGSAMRFRLGSTRWRGVRLEFTARWREVYRASWPVFVLAGAGIAAVFAANFLGGGPAWLVLGPVVLVVAFLCAVRLEFNYKSLLVLRARVGAQSGRWKPAYRDFLWVWLATAGVLIGCVALVVAALALVVGGSFAMLASQKERGLMAIVVIAAMVLGSVFILFLASAPARAYREARMFRLIWNNVGLGHIARFRCNLRTSGYVGLRVKNMFLTLLTLGFYRPFALVSEYRMKTESVTLHVKGGLDQLAGQLVAQQGGLGDAVADAVGLDLVG